MLERPCHQLLSWFHYIAVAGISTCLSLSGAGILTVHYHLRFLGVPVETVQLLRALDAFPENLGSILSTRVTYIHPYIKIKHLYVKTKNKQAAQ